MSSFLTPTDITSIAEFLSGPRLGTFTSISSSGAPEDAIELHQSTMSLGIAIMAVTGLIEVGLRNAVCTELDLAFGSGWLRRVPPALNWVHLEERAIRKAGRQAQRAVYSKMTGAEKVALDAIAYPTGVPAGTSHDQKLGQRQRAITVTDDQIIAQLTLHFWKRLFSNHYDNLLWKRALKRVFPNKSISRAEVAKHLEVIYSTRNRLAHHEPVYGSRLDETICAIDFISQNIRSAKASDKNSFCKLILPQREMLYGQVAIFHATFSRLT